ncbi:MAG: PEP-CTERM sorting domain-containing protein [Gemmatimonadales bacterium]|nr:PEP-CTERM sorting domain-containing protein [Gemmatimonadales bacterium]
MSITTREILSYGRSALAALLAVATVSSPARAQSGMYLDVQDMPGGVCQSSAGGQAGATASVFSPTAGSSFIDCVYRGGSASSWSSTAGGTIRQRISVSNTNAFPAAGRVRSAAISWWGDAIVLTPEQAAASATVRMEAFFHGSFQIWDPYFTSRPRPEMLIGNSLWLNGFSPPGPQFSEGQLPVTLLPLAQGSVGRYWIRREVTWTLTPGQTRIPFEIGQAIFGWAGHQAWVNGDFSNTAGIRAVEFFDANGRLLADITPTFERGTTLMPGYVPAPEPGTLLLLATGVAALAVRRARTA